MIQETRLRSFPNPHFHQTIYTIVQGRLEKLLFELKNSFHDPTSCLRIPIVTLTFIFLLIPTISALPKLCSEPEPVDLLGQAISSSGSSWPDGVEVVADEDHIKGYRFDSSARLLGVASKEIFPLCSRFPTEFSFLLTFKHLSKARTNQYVMALLAQDRRTVLLGLRLQRSRFSLDYFSTTSGEKKAISFKDSTLNDARWHTLVVTVTSKHVTFTLDCGSATRRKLGSDFPKGFKIKRTKIHIGSRRNRRNRFTGLLRQLVLLPGADASRQVCPSDNPALATLNDNSAPAPSPSNPSVIFEEDFSSNDICSPQTRGTLMYTQEMTMEICSGRSFKPVRGGSERLDYVIDYEDIITSNFTLSIEPFSIPGEGLFIATANNDDLTNNYSQIFKWDGKRFVKFQDIKTQSAMLWKFFQIDHEYFLVVANAGGGGVSLVSSVIYRYNPSPRRKRFERHQIIKTHNIRSMEFFQIDGNSYLFVANQRGPGQIPSPDDVGPSYIWIWDEYDRQFRRYQPLPTLGALDVTFFQISLNPLLTYSCFVVANAFNGETSRVLSQIYCWDQGGFNLRQSIETVGAADWEFFSFQDRYFLAVANSFDKVPHTEPQRILNSSIYELNVQYAEFLLYQEIVTYGANDWEFFTIGSQYFLVVANTVSSTSEIYRWQGIEKFVKVHSLPVGPCSDFDYIFIDGSHYLTYANPNGIYSKLYKIVTY